MEFIHKSVLLNESINSLDIKKDNIYIDATLGGGGHSLEIAKKLDKGKLICIDQDIDAINFSKNKLIDYKDKIYFCNGNFKNVKKYLYDLKIDKVDGIFADLGVSSYQFDNPNRGFSYRFDAKLDMRMDVSSDLSAFDVINTYSKEKLIQIFYDYGEEKWSKRIAEFIVEKRKEKTINTTLELVDIIKMAIPKSCREKSHPAKKVFQAIRIEVNKELDIISPFIDDCVDILNKNGVISIITFHSLEDRLVKNKFKYYVNPCDCPKEYLCICNKKSQLELINKKPIIPNIEEIKENNRSRSAKLRSARKL